MIYMKEDDDCRVKEKITKRRKNNDDQLLHQKILMISKMVDDRKTIFVLYILTHDENKVFMIVVLTVAVLSMKEQVVNVPEPL